MDSFNKVLSQEGDNLPLKYKMNILNMEGYAVMKI